ncbi:MAG TPA: hypothetical protein PK992_10625 [Planctomycetaceae bacterium]|nr:hypothetical protein [Planctomycetaceae bacterium]HRA88520.1 hypothetical protein [Planctomycetaceae bacterium]
MNRFTLTNGVASGIVCLTLAAVGIVQTQNTGAPVVHDGSAPYAGANSAQHLDELKITNPILNSLEL